MTKNNSKNNNKKYEATSSGYREVDDSDKDKAAITEAVTLEKKVSATQDEAGKKSKGDKKAEKISDEKLKLETNMDIPYPELGHTVSQLAGMETHKRKSILVERDDEFVKKYM